MVERAAAGAGLELKLIPKCCATDGVHTQAPRAQAVPRTSTVNE
jgi:hypothetical protein